LLIIVWISTGTRAIDFRYDLNTNPYNLTPLEVVLPLSIKVMVRPKYIDGFK